MVRLALAALLAFQPVLQAAELAPVDILLTRAIPRDEAALATTGPEKGERLAKLQSDLALVAEGLEGFASEEDARPSLKRLREAVDSPDQFKDRASALDATYRALAVVDYTWAKRLPEAPCSPESSRARLLKSGSLSSWLASLLGPGVEGADTSAKLDEASAVVPASAREYALLRAKIHRLTQALGSEKAVGSTRAVLYCRRAGAYAALSAANLATPAGLVAASRAASADDAPGVYLLARKDADGLELLGAATAVEDSLVTDGRLAEGDGLVILRRGKKGLIPVRVVRRDGSGLALLRADVPVKGFVLAESSPAKDDLIEAIGHPERTGAWTRVRGLVTTAELSSFQTDAAIDVGMAGGAALTEDGRLAGVFVLRSARAEGKSFDWPVAVSAPALKSWLAGGELTVPSTPIELSESGTASIQTASRRLLDSRAPGAQATEASHLYFYDGNTRAVCKANCDDAAPSSGSSYSPNGGAELGAALGKAMAPMVEALIFRGIPALFRGIGSLFKSRPKVPQIESHASELPRAPEKPKLPDPKYEIRVTAEQSDAMPGETVRFIATLTRNRDDMPLGNVHVDFAVPNGDPVSGVTDEFGRIVVSVEPAKSVKAHNALDEESRRHPLLITTGREHAIGACKTVVNVAAGTVALGILAASLAGGPPVVIMGGNACVHIVGGAAAAGVACGTIFAVDAIIDPKTAVPPPPLMNESRANADDARVESSAERAHHDMGEEARRSVEREGATGQPKGPDDPDPDEIRELERSVENRRMTAKDAEAAAEKLGFDKKIPAQKAPFNSHGRPVFQNGNKFITPDADGHNGGVWKMFNRAGQRLGTFDKNLVRIGD